MNREAQLENRIETAIEDLKRSYTESLSSIASLKKRVNDLELSTSENGSSRADPNTEELNSAVEKLDKFIDSVISQAARTRKECENLKRKCAALSLEPRRLRDLVALCSESEQLAKDLLCFSLGRLRK